MSVHPCHAHLPPQPPPTLGFGELLLGLPPPPPAPTNHRVWRAALGLPRDSCLPDIARQHQAAVVWGVGVGLCDGGAGGLDMVISELGQERKKISSARGLGQEKNVNS